MDLHVSSATLGNWSLIIANLAWWCVLWKRQKRRTLECYIKGPNFYITYSDWIISSISGVFSINIIMENCFYVHIFKLWYLQFKVKHWNTDLVSISLRLFKSRIHNQSTWTWMNLNLDVYIYFQVISDCKWSFHQL